MRELHPALADYLTELPREASLYQPSLFWERKLAERGVLDVDPEILDRFLAAEVLDVERSDNEGDRIGPALEIARRARKRAKQLALLRDEVGKQEWEHAQAVAFLDTRGLLDDYRRFLDDTNLRSQMQTARHFWYSRRVRDFTEAACLEGALDVLEIGAGPAWLSVALDALLPIHRYVVIELPQNIVQGAYVASRWLREQPLTVNELADTGWVFLAPRLLERVPDGSADMVINVASFMEMDRDVRDSYIRDAYRVGKPGALFVNVNRRQRRLPQRDGGVFDNNPLLYPYSPSDQVIAWEEDDFEQATRAKHLSTPSLAVLRAAVINL